MSRTINYNDTANAVPSGYDPNNSSYSSVSSSYPISNGYSDSSSTNYAYITCRTGSRAASYISYTFDVDIPNNATITSVNCLVKTRISSTNYISTAVMQLYSDSTAKGLTTDFRSTSATARTVSGGNDWTVNELQNIQIRCTATRGTSNTSRAAYIYFYGADLTIEYYVSGILYEINVSSNVPTVTISAQDNEVSSGDNTKVIINGDISNIKLLDNNVDVTQLITQGTIEPTYEVNTAPNADYGFNLINEWYVSQNKGIDSSAAVARVSLNLPVQCNVTFTFINYAEASYDFGIFGKIDTALSTDAFSSDNYGGDTTTDSGKEQLRLNSSTYNTSSEQTLSYTVSSGEHFIDVKFGKDQASASYNDTLQFKVSIDPLETIPSGNFYEYVLTNVQEDHTITIIQSGNNIFIKVNGSWVKASNILIKINGVWKSIDSVYSKENGTWTKNNDVSVIFNNNVNFINGGNT